MKKILLIFVLISTSLISFCQQTLEVELVSISNIYFNCDGSEWTHKVIVNQKLLLKNKSVYLNLSETNILFIEINCHKNEKRQSNYGDNSVLIDLNEIDLSKVYSFTTEVTIIENGECYKDNKIKWKYSFIIKKINKN
ncbi:MAG: hypothetical protein GQ564_16615 [Bacteroidales bacterium]|nr:hypothetical protein [Bacteroidales bacterium]